ncbi:MAG TPA: hypothetical protein PLH94_14900 [Fimbriimonadaceae bacterium]|nr:hypothetical protein [Fimbriimonadaceae bacterium]
MSEAEARRKAFLALDRLEGRPIEAARAAWQANPPQGGLQFFGLRDPRTGDAEMLRLPPGPRLTWQFATDEVWVGVDAETGAICHVSGLMGGRAPGLESNVRQSVPEKTRRSKKAASPSPARSPKETNTSYSSLWGLAAIPVAVGAWLALRSRR